MNIFEAIIFYLISFTAIFGALGTIFANKIIYAIMFSFFTLISVGFLFFGLELPYLAAVQIALYAIGISVLFIFALMLTAKNKESELLAVFRPRTVIALVGIVLISFLTVLFLRYSLLHPDTDLEVASSVIMPSAKTIAIEMFVNYGAAFVFSSLYFLSAILGFGVILSRYTGGKK